MKKIVVQYDQGKITRSQALVEILKFATKEDAKNLPEEWKQWLLEYLDTFPILVQEWKGFVLETCEIEMGEDFWHERVDFLSRQLVKPSQIDTSDFGGLLGKFEMESAAKEVVKLCQHNNDSWDTEISDSEMKDDDKVGVFLLEEYGWIAHGYLRDGFVARVRRQRIR